MSSGLRTSVNIFVTVILVLGLYTWVSNAIPQVESEVPATLTITADVTPEQLVSSGEELFLGAANCTSCHGLGTRAPNLRQSHEAEGPIGARCATRVPGQDCKAYIYESMIDPTAYLVEGFPAIMLDQRRTLSNDQIWALVAYMESLGGTVTVSYADIDATRSGEGAPAPADARFTSTDPLEIMEHHVCLQCHGLEGPDTDLGPTFEGIGSRRSKEEIWRSILDPRAEFAPGFEGVTTMPDIFGEDLTAAQLGALVDFLFSLK